MVYADAFLGENTPVRFHGPSVDISTGTSTYHEEWMLRREFHDGVITVHTTTGLQGDLKTGVVDHVSYSLYNAVKWSPADTTNEPSEEIR